MLIRRGKEPLVRRRRLVEVAVAPHQRQQLLRLLEAGIADLDTVGERPRLLLRGGHRFSVWNPIGMGFASLG